MSVIFEHSDKGHYTVYVVQGNDVKTYAGDLLMGDDGFWMYWPVHGKYGGIPGWFLTRIAEKIKELDEPMEQSLREWFGENDDKAN
jgi:hypothetical protein